MPSTKIALFLANVGNSEVALFTQKIQYSVTLSPRKAYIPEISSLIMFFQNLYHGSLIQSLKMFKMNQLSVNSHELS